MSEEKEERPHLICSRCKQKVNIEATYGMVGDCGIRCKCEAVFPQYALTVWYESGYSKGLKDLQEQLTEALGL